MADVKISELPSINSVEANDVLIVNDASSGTTCQTTVNKVLNSTRSYTVTAGTGLSMTGTVVVNQRLCGSLSMITLDCTNLVLSNSSGADVQATLTLSSSVNGVFGGLLNTGCKIEGTSVNASAAVTTTAGLTAEITNNLIRFIGVGTNNNTAKQQIVYVVPNNASVTINAHIILYGYSVV